LGSPLSPDEFPKAVLEGQYFVDDCTSHCTDPIALELKNRIASLLKPRQSGSGKI
jgi:hypothetical protein